MPKGVLGRNNLLGSITERLDELADGRGGSLGVIGDPGVGKSTILAAVISEAQQRGMAVRRSAGVEEQRFRAYGLLRRAWGPDFLVANGRPAAGPSRHWLQEAFVELLGEMASRQPLVVALDDLHWSDAASVRLIDEAVGRLHADRVLWVLAAREPGGGSETPCIWPGNVTELVRLEPLDASSVAELAAGLIGGQPGPELVKLLDDCGGSPLYIKELCRTLQAEGWLHPGEQGGARMVDVPLNAPTPHGFRSMILRSLNQLPPESRKALQTASVLGSIAPLQELAAVAGVSEESLHAVLRPACEADVVTVANRQVRFRHDLVRRAVYESLPVSVRMSAHDDLARRLADHEDGLSTLAWHHLLSRLPAMAPGQPGPPVALDSGEAMADILKHISSEATGLVSSAPDTVADVLRATAVTVPDRDPWSHRLLIQQAWAEMTSGVITAGEELARSILSQEHDPQIDVELLELLGESLSFQRRYAEAAAALAEAVPLAQELDHCGRLRVARAFNSAMSGSSLPEAVAEFELLRSDVALTPSTRARAALWLALSAGLHGDLNDAVRLADEARHRARVTGTDPVVRSLPYYVRALALGDADRWDEAHATVREGIAMAQQEGFLVDLPLHLSVRAGLLLQQGQWSDALAEAETAIAVSQSIGSLRNVAPMHGLIAEVALRRGDHAAAVDGVMAAERVLPAALAITPTSGLTVTKAALSAEPSEALEVLRLAWDVATHQDAGCQLLKIGPALSAALRARGDEAAARGVAGQSDALAARIGTAYAQGVAQRCHGLAEDDLDSLRRAVALLRMSPRIIDLADTLCDVARLALVTRKQRLATQAAQEAAALYRTVGAELPAFLSVALGSQDPVAKPENRPTTGWPSLTPSERQVAGLVAAGMTNREIAKELGISHRTVETHISHALTKLSERSRVGLARYALTHAAAERNT